MSSICGRPPHFPDIFRNHSNSFWISIWSTRSNLMFFLRTMLCLQPLELVIYMGVFHNLKFCHLSRLGVMPSWGSPCPDCSIPGRACHCSVNVPLSPLSFLKTPGKNQWHSQHTEGEYSWSFPLSSVLLKATVLPSCLPPPVKEPLLTPPNTSLPAMLTSQVGVPQPL